MWRWSWCSSGGVILEREKEILERENRFLERENVERGNVAG